MALKSKSNLTSGLNIAITDAKNRQNTSVNVRSILQDIIDSMALESEISGATNTYWTSGSTGSYSIKAINDSGLDATYDYAVAEGYATLASGRASHAEGEGSIASGQGAHAEGNYSTASGDAAHAEGQQTTTSGNYSHSEGTFTIASGDSSHAEGDSTTASGYASHAEGQQTIALGYVSHAEGGYTLANDNYSHAEGVFSQAIGGTSHAEGDSTTASGYASHSEGNSTTATGDASHAEGNSTTASGLRSHAEGYSTIASGDASHAGGSYTQANGIGSFVHGSGSTASGNGTIVLGNGITGTSVNTVYVPNLNIKTIGGGTSISNLGIDVSGNVVSGIASTDIRVTGGTYTAGTTTFINNTGGTFSVSGFSTGTIKGTVSTNLGTLTGGAIPFCNGVTDTVTTLAQGTFGQNFYFNPNNTQAGGSYPSLHIGTVFGLITGHYNSNAFTAQAMVSGFVAAESNNGGNCYTVVSANAGMSSFFTWGALKTGSHIGTSIPFAYSSGIMTASNNSYNPTGTFIQKQAVYINLLGEISTNFGNRNDTIGLRIDTIANLHTTNLNAFTVNGKSFFGGNSAATATVDIAASTTGATSLRIRSGVAPTTPNNGDIWFDGANLKMRISGVTKTFTLT